ncbi:HupE/UreJ family protein [Sphingomonas sp. LB-2]|uniref:HupE/UreJ family protein n=1 Tax=Sphingomonas caeni TaxID=2984949 RepID=UPI00223275E8|nr:HupE/UreJ family protein [Sphingomonas caeni]MCW3848057.1 HupE/UreJ family protein [Sphingomonas caeni]
MRLARMTAAAVLLIAASPALAHDGHGGGLAGGFAHPFTGADHMLAMIAVGLFAALKGGRAVWAWPAMFVGAAALGFAGARFGVALPLVEPMILASMLVLGLLVAAAVPVAVVPGIALVALFGLAHGQAHAFEAGSQSIAAFAAGFLLASAGLHAAGISFYRILGQVPGRLAGAATVAGGLALAFA